MIPHNKEYGAYTVGEGWGEEFVAHADSNGTITDLTASAIGFSFTAGDSEIGEISLIKTDGTFAKGDGKSDADGFYVGRGL